MQWLALIMKLLPYLPTIVRVVEGMHGSAPGQGVKKLETAISLIQHVEPAIAAAVTSDPDKKGRLEGLIGGVVAGINAAKTWQAPEGEKSPFPQ